MTCNIIQHGVDGFGHQLYGLFTTLILHNIKKYNFRGDIFMTKKFNFGHVSKKESLDLQYYMLETINNFVKENTFNKIKCRFGNMGPKCCTAFASKVATFTEKYIGASSPSQFTPLINPYAYLQ